MRPFRCRCRSTFTGRGRSSSLRRYVAPSCRGNSAFTGRGRCSASACRDVARLRAADAGLGFHFHYQRGLGNNNMEPDIEDKTLELMVSLRRSLFVSAMRISWGVRWKLTGGIKWGRKKGKPFGCRIRSCPGLTEVEEKRGGAKPRYNNRYEAWGRTFMLRGLYILSIYWTQRYSPKPKCDARLGDWGRGGV